jgi:DNA-binding transcriptional LysR family regulator
MIAAAGAAPIKSPHDVAGRSVLAFEPGCPYRARLEDWFARGGEMSDRIVEMSSYHAMLGCAVAGMGVSLVPRIVLRTFPDAELLSVHTLPGVATAPTVFFRRKGTVSPKISALLDILLAQPGVATTFVSDGKRRKRAAAAAQTGRSRS